MVRHGKAHRGFESGARLLRGEVISASPSTLGRMDLGESRGLRISALIPQRLLPGDRGNPGVMIEFGNPKHVVNFPLKILPNSGLHGAGDVKARWEASEKHIRAITSLIRQKSLFST